MNCQLLSSWKRLKIKTARSRGDVGGWTDRQAGPEGEDTRDRVKTERLRLRQGGERERERERERESKENKNRETERD
jgi:hypothetical protein